MSKHTPGPWSYHFDHPTTDEVGYIRSSSGEVAVMYGCQREEQQSANACLIAAAPCLLEALQRSLNWLASYPGGNAEGCYDQARAAIAKATGAQP